MTATEATQSSQYEEDDGPPPFPRGFSKSTFLACLVEGMPERYALQVVDWDEAQLRYHIEADSAFRWYYRRAPACALRFAVQCARRGMERGDIRHLTYWTERFSIAAAGANQNTQDVSVQIADFLRQAQSLTGSVSKAQSKHVDRPPIRVNLLPESLSQ